MIEMVETPQSHPSPPNSPPPGAPRWVLPNLVLKSHFSFAGCGRSGHEIRHLVTWPKRVCAAEQGMVFRVLNLKQGMQFRCLAS